MAILKQALCAFHNGAIGAYGPRTARVKVGYVLFTQNKLLTLLYFYLFSEPFNFFCSVNGPSVM